MLPLLLTGLAPLTGASQAADGLVSTAPVTLSGIATTQAPGGHLYTQGATAASNTVLEAEHIVVETTWEQGIRTGSDDTISRTTTDNGTESTAFSDTEARFSTLPKTTGAPEFLAFPPDNVRTLGDLVIEATGLPRTQIHPVAERTVIHTGLSRDAQHVGEMADPSFRYDTREPVAWHEAPGTATVTGSFTLFANNVTLQLTTPQGTWTDWTGYTEEAPDQPVSRYEHRMSLLHVTNGTLRTDSQAPLVTFGPELTTTLDGSLTTPSATGLLDLGNQILHYDQDPLELSGTPTLEVHLEAQQLPETTSPGTGPTTPASRLALSLDPSGTFYAVTPEGTTAIPRTGDGPSPLTTTITLAAAALTLVLLGAAAMVATPPGRRLADHIQTWRFERWMEHGKDATRARRWADAAKAYRHATEIKPHHSSAWFLRAISELEMHKFEACLETLDAADRAVAMDPWDRLQLRAAASWYAGERETAERCLAGMAEMDLELAQRFVHGIRIPLEELSDDLEQALDGPGSRTTPPWARDPDRAGGLDGYA